MKYRKGYRMGIPKRALCFNEARAEGLVFSEYAFKGLPEDFSAVIKYKVWGKSSNLLIFLEDPNGDKYSVSIFRRHDNLFYTPRNMPDFDLASQSIQPGMLLAFKTKRTRSGNTDLVEAKII